MKKQNTGAIIWIGIIAFIAVIFVLLIAGAEEDYCRITNVDYKAVVMDEPGSEGSILITERLTFDVHADYEDNLYWELWRDLPESYVDGAKVDYTVYSVKQILSDGSEIIYEESPVLYWDDEDYVAENTELGPHKWFHSEGPYDEDAAQYECVLFYVDGVYREEMVFEIQYVMHNAVLRYNDCSDLYISLYSGETIEDLKSFDAQILIPNKDMPKQGNYDVTTYGTNSNVFPVTESATANPGYYTFSFSLDEEDLQFKSYNQYIEFDLVSYGNDKHIFSEYASTNYYTEDDVLEEILADQKDYREAPAHFAEAKMIVFILAIVGSVIIAFIALWTLQKKKTTNTFYDPDDRYEYYRDLPNQIDPIFARTLVFCKENKPVDDAGVYAALLLSLARKGYVNLVNQKTDDVLIELTPSEEELTPSEKLYYKLLDRHAGSTNSIRMETFRTRIEEDYEHTTNFTKNLKEAVTNYGLKEGYFQVSDYTKPKKELRTFATVLTVVGILFITVVNLISMFTRLDLAYGAFFVFGLSCLLVAIYLFKKANPYILLTRKGENEYQKWRGFYLFLRDDNELHLRTDIDVNLMEYYLVYAAAFGLSEKLSKTLELRFPEGDSSSIVYHPYYRSGRIHVHCHHFHTSVHTSVATSASGGSGGYGGGGRGGGGGGGGH